MTMKCVYSNNFIFYGLWHPCGAFSDLNQQDLSRSLRGVSRLLLD